MNQRWWVAVVVCVLAGFGLRVWNIDFDQRQHLHPDERHWALTSAALDRAEAPEPHGTVLGPVLDWLDGQRSPTNVYRATETFVYGPVTLAMARGLSGWLHAGVVDGDQPAAALVDLADWTGIPLLAADGSPRFDSAYQVDLVGRLLGAVADSLTVLVVALVGRRLGGRSVGLAAAAVHALSVLAIQHAHYLGSEPLLALTAAVTVWATVRADRSGRVGRAIGGGLPIGLAAGATVAVKLTGLALASIPFIALAAVALRHRRPADLLRVASAVAGFAVAVRVLLPPAFVGLGLSPNAAFWNDVERSRRLGEVDSPPAIQWADRVPFVDGTRWLFWLTVGPGAFIAAVVGLVLLVRRRDVVGRFPAAVIVGAVVVPWAFVFRTPVVTGRYFMPMLPGAAVAAGYGFVAAGRAAWCRRHGLPGRLGVGAIAVGGGAVLLWALAFVAGVHGHDHTRIAASQWIAANVPAGSTVTVEAWDDGLPLAIDGVSPLDYESVQLDLFGADTVDKIEHLTDQLAEVDYVIESSPRVWNSVVRIPARFPATINFFRALDDGRLGFDRVATFTSPPRLGPWRLDEAGADESFSVYDHPEVRIWQRTRDVARADVLGALDVQAAAIALPVHPAAASANGGLLLDQERAENQRLGTFDSQFTTTGVLGSSIVQSIGWSVAVALIAIATFVLLSPLLGRLPDAGAGVAAPAGLVVLALATLIAVGWFSLALTQELVTSLAALWIGAGGIAALRRRAELAAIWASKRRAMMQAAGFAMAMGSSMLVLRAANPDLWHVYRGGEKPFELAMLTSTLRSRTLPPPDTWFSGGALSYYYGGSLLVSIPARLLRTAPQLALNLGVALVGMLAAGAAYTAGAAVSSLRSGGIGGGRADVPATVVRSRDAITRRAGGLSVASVLLVPNLAIVASIVGRLTGSEDGPFDWWALSRLVPSSPIVNEFPAWSLLFADLHAHLIDLPIMLTLLAVCVAWFRSLTPVSTRPAGAIAGAMVVGAVVGAVRATNTWDFPLAGGIAAIAVVAAIASGRRRVAGRVLGLTALAVGVAVVGWAPYTSRFEVTDAGVERVTRPTPLASAAQQFGLWAVITVVGFVAAFAPAVPPFARRLATWGNTRSRRGAMLAGTAGASALAAAMFVWAVRADRVVLFGAVVLTIGAVGSAAAGRVLRPAVGPGPFVAIALGWFAVAMIESFSVINDFDRMNTVFKGWFQAWALLAVGCAGVLAGLVRRGYVRAGDGPSRLRRVVATGAAAMLVVTSAISVAFVRLAVPARLDDRTSPGGLSLDGLGYLDADMELAEQAVTFDPAEDRPLIEWLQANVVGLPTIVEAPGRGYAWTSRVAGLTGLPTVIGWSYHESQQRRTYTSVIDQRVADVANLYTSADERVMLDVLWRYDVQYVVFGTAERVLVATAPDTATALAALEQLACTSEVFRSGATFVSAVDQQCVSRRVLG